MSLSRDNDVRVDAQLIRSGNCADAESGRKPWRANAAQAATGRRSFRVVFILPLLSGSVAESFREFCCATKAARFARNGDTLVVATEKSDKRVATSMPT